LKRIFPEADVQDWTPVINPKGKVLSLIEALTTIPLRTAIHSEADKDIWSVPKAHLMKRLGFKQLSQLNTLLKHKDLVATMKEKGYIVQIERKEIWLRRL
jgi:hypothetical protein